MPESIFLVTTKKESTEKILRISDNIRKYTKINFDACPGNICINNDSYFCIRLRDLESFENVPVIQRAYMDSGIKFMKAKKVKTKGIISLKKLFAIDKINDKIFKDTDRPMYYLVIEEQLTWSHFNLAMCRVESPTVVARPRVAIRQGP